MIKASAKSLVATHSITRLPQGTLEAARTAVAKHLANPKLFTGELHTVHLVGREGELGASVVHRGQLAGNLVRVEEGNKLQVLGMKGDGPGIWADVGPQLSETSRARLQNWLPALKTAFAENGRDLLALSQTPDMKLVVAHSARENGVEAHPVGFTPDHALEKPRLSASSWVRAPLATARAVRLDSQMTSAIGSAEATLNLWADLKRHPHSFSVPGNVVLRGEQVDNLPVVKLATSTAELAGSLRSLASHGEGLTKHYQFPALSSLVSRLQDVMAGHTLSFAGNGKFPMDVAAAFMQLPQNVKTIRGAFPTQVAFDQVG